MSSSWIHAEASVTARSRQLNQQVCFPLMCCYVIVGDEWFACVHDECVVEGDWWHGRRRHRCILSSLHTHTLTLLCTPFAVTGSSSGRLCCMLHVCSILFVSGVRTDWVACARAVSRKLFPPRGRLLPVLFGCSIGALAFGVSKQLHFNRCIQEFMQQQPASSYPLAAKARAQSVDSRH